MKIRISRIRGEVYIVQTVTWFGLKRPFCWYYDDSDWDGENKPCAEFKTIEEAREACYKRIKELVFVGKDPKTIQEINLSKK